MRKYKRKKICIICEGYEELDYIETLKSKAVFSDKYDFITVNAKSINTIIARYQEKYQSDSYSLVLIFCDTDVAKLSLVIYGNFVYSSYLFFYTLMLKCKWK